jgi:hypothetical protein
MSPDERDEMTAAAIARLAGVSRAAVSTGRPEILSGRGRGMAEVDR